MLPLLVLLGTIAGAWYLLIVLPQRQQQTRHGALVSQLQVGDHVLTVGGIYGRVVGLSPGAADVELSGPGSATRIATDAIARILPGGGPDPTHPTSHADARPPVTNMQQHTNPNPYDQSQTDPHATASGYVAPPPPAFGQPMFVAQQHVAPQTQPMLAPQPMIQPPVAAPFAPTTLRAHVVDPGSALPPAPILTPWADVAPRQAAAPVAAPQMGSASAQRPAPVSPGFQLAHQQQVAAQQFASPQQYAPAPHQYAQAAPQYAPAPAVPQQQYAPAPVAPQHYAAAPAAPQYAPVAPQYMQQVPQGAPAPAPVQAPHMGIPSPQFVAPNVVAPVAAPLAHQPAVTAPAPQDGAGAERSTQMAGRRPRSRAPEGMGSSLRLDDPSLQDTMVRARNERAGLADEYRRASAPLVDASPAPEHAPVAPTYAPAAPGRLFAHDNASQSAMPRPNVTAPSEQVDPALYQRRTPMAHMIAPTGDTGFATAPAPAAAAPAPVATPA